MRLSLTTPKGSIIDVEAEEITAPGALGEFGVLPGHISFLSALKPGVLVFRTKDVTRVFAVGQGVLQVAHADAGDKILVLVDQAQGGADIDRDAAASELGQIDAELAAWKKEPGGELSALLLRRAWTAARVDAAARVAPH